MSVPPNPIEHGGLGFFAVRLRTGQTSAAATTEAYLSRIASLDPVLGAFLHVAAEKAMEDARRIDDLLGQGYDLGPLMGVPIAVKDLFAVESMPTSAGSNLDVADLIGEEGSFVRSLRRAGCVILGLAKTPEFARSGVGLAPLQGTPRNPWDAQIHRVPGGSSSGSAVAVSAGLAAFAIGSDTTGSVRTPAAFCGVVGLKTTKGLWPTDGVFPLSPTLDTIGLLTRSVADTALVFCTLTHQPVPAAAILPRLRLGRPTQLFTDLDAPIEAAFDRVLASLQSSGVEIVAVEIPEIAERDDLFKLLVSAELIGVLGRERFLASRDIMDSDIWQRTEPGLALSADEHARIVARHRELCVLAEQRMAGLDGWISPTSPLQPESVAALADENYARRYTAAIGRNTWAGSLFGLCGLSLPIGLSESALPIGLQLLCPARQELRALSIGIAMEKQLGCLPMPPLSRAGGRS